MRALHRVAAGGTTFTASDNQTIAACDAWQGRFVNLVLRR
jgi:hypothetical protein